MIFTKNAIIKIASVLPTGKMSKIRTVVVEKQDYAKATKAETDKSGLREQYVAGKFLSVEDLKKVENWQTIENSDKIKSLESDKPSASILTGFIDIPETAVYEFGTNTDQLFIDGKLLVSNDGEVKRFSRHNSMVALEKGKHAVKVVFINNSRGGVPAIWDGVQVFMRKSGDAEFKKVENKQFSH